MTLKQMEKWKIYIPFTLDPIVLAALRLKLGLKCAPFSINPCLPDFKLFATLNSNTFHFPSSKRNVREGWREPKKSPLQLYNFGRCLQSTHFKFRWPGARTLKQTMNLSSIRKKKAQNFMPYRCKVTWDQGQFSIFLSRKYISCVYILSLFRLFSIHWHTKLKKSEEKVFVSP